VRACVHACVRVSVRMRERVVQSARCPQEDRLGRRGNEGGQPYKKGTGQFGSAQHGQVESRGNRAVGVWFHA
jgi:hypothetical protein